MNSVTSFIGEHTIELTIVPILKKILEVEFEYVVPVFPWMTREGGNLSRQIHKDDKFQILGLYPRRPKFSMNSDELTYLKISNQIIFGAISGQEVGIPIIGGLPLVRNLWDLSNEPNCLWFNLDFNVNEPLEYQIKIDDDLEFDKYLTNRLLRSNSEIFEVVRKHAKTFNIINAMSAFRKIKMDSMNLDFYSSFAYMGGYKPVYFLLK